MRFIICVHDATPAYDRETRLMIRDLAPRAGRRLTFGVVPDWYGSWPLAKHKAYCRLLSESSGELLLHGLHHRRARGRGPITWLTGGSDEMNGLSPAETHRAIDHGQRVFTDMFGAPARGFVAPAWQPGHVRAGDDYALAYTLGFLAIRTAGGLRVPLATATWDCGRWSGLGHAGHGFGSLLRLQRHRVPVLALHPRDIGSTFWSKILRLTDDLLGSGYEPVTVTELLEEGSAEVSA